MVEVLVSIETVSALRHAPRTAHAHWLILPEKISFLTLFEQNKQHLFDSCCQISLVILNMKFNLNLVNSFGEFDVSPFKEIGSTLACPRSVSKMAAE